MATLSPVTLNRAAAGFSGGRFRFQGGFLGLLGRAFEALMTWQQRAVERHHLMSLNDHQLKDIGLSRADIEQEAGKPFWRA